MPIIIEKMFFFLIRSLYIYDLYKECNFDKADNVFRNKLSSKERIIIDKSFRSINMTSITVNRVQTTNT